MGLDIRLPIGLMFGLLGPILVATGLYEGTRLNTLTGLSMTAFAALMLALGLAGQRRQRPPAPPAAAPAALVPDGIDPVPAPEGVK